MNELLKKSATEQSKAIKNKEISAVELTKAALDRINSLDEKLGCFNSLTEDTALETAKKVDEKVARAEELPLLAGVPLALKDNMNLVGSRTTASSKILENFVSPFNATITQKLLDNCVPILGKANLDEFAIKVRAVLQAVQQQALLRAKLRFLSALTPAALSDFRHHSAVS